MSDYENILALDTATYVQTVAILEGELVRERLDSRVRYNHGRALLPNVDSVFDKHEIDLEDLDLISVGLGPGAFTGLRVSLAMAKSFCRSADIDLIGVSTLAALAYDVAHLRPEETICPMYDARRNEVYMGMYEYADSNLNEILTDRTASPSTAKQLLESQAESTSRVTIVGNGPREYKDIAEVDADNVDISPAWLNAPSAVSLGLLGRSRANKSGPDSVSELEPNYIRPSDAEL